MKYYNIFEAKKLKIDYPDIYFTPEYGEACEYSDNAKWELCIYKDLMFCYLIKNDENKIITPYGYSGVYYKNMETFNEFIVKFRIYLKSIKINEEIIRQNPYINININSGYKLIKEKSIFAIKITNINDYFKSINSENKKSTNASLIRR